MADKRGIESEVERLLAQAKGLTEEQRRIVGLAAKVGHDLCERAYKETAPFPPRRDSGFYELYEGLIERLGEVFDSHTKKERISEYNSDGFKQLMDSLPGFTENQIIFGLDRVSPDVLAILDDKYHFRRYGEPSPAGKTESGQERVRALHQLTKAIEGIEIETYIVA